MGASLSVLRGTKYQSTTPGLPENTGPYYRPPSAKEEDGNSLRREVLIRAATLAEAEANKRKVEERIRVVKARVMQARKRAAEVTSPPSVAGFFW